MGYDIDNKLMPGMGKRRATIASSVQFWNDILESQTRVNYVPKWIR